ncbi:MAG: HIT family protein [Alphaproteobacteria bacterium]|nr:HIT family protein [Alphaproteobacteria bacterium]
MTGFQLNERLEADSHAVCALELCDVRLMNDNRYCWLLLVPRRAGLSEWHELAAEDAAQLSAEISRASGALKTITGADKINVAAIGNMVRQMHVHVVARHEGDETWPGTVWNSGAAIPHEAEALQAVRKKISQELAPGV